MFTACAYADLVTKYPRAAGAALALIVDTAREDLEVFARAGLLLLLGALLWGVNPRVAAQRTADRLAEAGVAAEVAVVSGPAAESVIDFADELEADLIVLGGSSRPALVERLLGSLAIDLVQHSGRQVLVVTEPAA